MKLLYFFVRRWSSSSDRRNLHARLTMMQPKYEARGWKSKCVSGAHTVQTTALLSAVRLTTQYGFTVYCTVACVATCTGTRKWYATIHTTFLKQIRFTCDNCCETASNVPCHFVYSTIALCCGICASRPCDLQLAFNTDGKVPERAGLSCVLRPLASVRYLHAIRLPQGAPTFSNFRC